VIMATQNEVEMTLEDPKEPRQNSEGSSPTEVLETMRNLIVELQVFKEDNDKLKNAATRIVRNKRSKDKKRSKNGLPKMFVLKE
jgi:hypothetical protein